MTAFDTICAEASIPLCGLVNSGDEYFQTGAIDKCYARSVEISNTIIYQIGTTVLNIGAIFVILIILYNIYMKVTAIGRREMFNFYSNFLLLTFLSIINDCGVIPISSEVYTWFVSWQNSMVSVCCWCLVFNGLLGFELWEDGKTRSMVLLYFSNLLVFLVTFVVSMFTFHDDWSTFVNKENSTALFVVLYVLNGIFLLAYIVSQFLLSYFVLRNWWALGAFSLAITFFITGQIMIYTISNTICQGANHYLDGLFFGTLSLIFAMMMIFKYWDIITSEDLEISVFYTGEIIEKY